MKLAYPPKWKNTPKYTWVHATLYGFVGISIVHTKDLQTKNKKETRGVGVTRTMNEDWHVTYQPRLKSEKNQVNVMLTANCDSSRDSEKNKNRLGFR